jgi:hypothetical protein
VGGSSSGSDVAEMTIRDGDVIDHGTASLRSTP